MDVDKFKKLRDKFEKEGAVDDFKERIRPKDPNIFRILGAAQKENRHSDFLAWLLDPTENHDLGKAVLEPFLIKAKIPQNEVKEITRGEVEVYREKQYTSDTRLDILIKCKTHVICIEVKLSPGDDSKQLSEYKKVVDKQFPKLKQTYVYLTPCGSPPDVKDYVAMSFKKDIVEIQKKEKKNANKITKSLIEQYVEIWEGGACGK